LQAEFCFGPAAVLKVARTAWVHISFSVTPGEGAPRSRRFLDAT